MPNLTDRKTIRRRVGRLTGDLLLCTATANGTTTSLTDALALNHEQSILLGRHGLFSGGTAANLGRIVRVTANTKATQTLQFTPAVPDITAVGDELELHNERDEGCTPIELNNLINDGILDAAEDTVVPITSATLTFSTATPVLAIDDLTIGAGVASGAWQLITGVDWQDVYEDWHAIPSADIHVDRTARTLELKGRARWLADATGIRVRGASLAVPLTADTDTTPVNFEWLTHHVAAQALGLRLEKAYDRKDVEGRLLMLQQRADTLRTRLKLRLPGRAWRLS